MTTIEEKGPTAEDFFIVRPSLIRCIIKIGEVLQNSHVKWALGGDLAENLMNVFVSGDHVEILTDTKGVDEICKLMASYTPSKPKQVQEKQPREAEVDGKKFPFFMKGSYTEFSMEGAKVKVYGDVQFKVGEWEWGDTLEFEPERINVVGLDIPLVPLALKSELYIGLGWLDRAQKIADAIMRAHHT